MIRKDLLALVALTILLVGTPRAEAGPATPAAPQTPVAALGVDLLMREPEKHPGTLVVEGVVKTASKKEQPLALIDVEEYRKCRVVTCALLALPVRWAGEMPAVLDIIRVEGEVTTVNGKMLFAARKLEKVPETKKP
jgi:hypothetical protein